jgi:regulator of protease activity HflC (stomatin/prohibitin superfamily)
MFDAIFQWLRDIWSIFWPVLQIEQFNRGIILRGGKFKKMIGPGLHLRIPFLDTKLEETVVPTTYDLSSQSLVTLDGKEITVKAMFKSQITDVKKFLLEVYDTKNAMGDIIMGIIARMIMSSDWTDLRGEAINNEITKKARVEGKKIGIEILQVTLTSITSSRSIRIFSEGKVEL